MKPDTVRFILSEIDKEMPIADIARQLYLFERRKINLKILEAMEKLRLNDKPAIKIYGSFMRTYNISTLVNCEGDQVWFPTDRIKLLPDGEMLVEEWLYNAKVKEGKL